MLLENGDEWPAWCRATRNLPLVKTQSSIFEAQSAMCAYTSCIVGHWRCTVYLINTLLRDMRTLSNKYLRAAVNILHKYFILFLVYLWATLLEVGILGQRMNILAFLCSVGTSFFFLFLTAEMLQQSSFFPLRTL